MKPPRNYQQQLQGLQQQLKEQTSAATEKQRRIDQLAQENAQMVQKISASQQETALLRQDLEKIKASESSGWRPSIRTAIALEKKIDFLMEKLENRDAAIKERESQDPANDPGSQGSCGRLF